MTTDDALQLPIPEASIAQHVTRGRHHVTWYPKIIGPGDTFLTLCEQLCTAIPSSRGVIGRLLPTADAPISEILEPLTRFDISVRFSPERANYVERLIRARRSSIATGLGV